MSNYGVFILSIFVFMAGAIIGIKTYHPVDMVHYKALGDLISECTQRGGILTTQSNQATCSPSKAIFVRTLNNSYFMDMDR
jgi:hypothetical protein